MMNRSFTGMTFAFFLVLALQACAAGGELKTGPASPSDLSGTYTLLLYGCHYGDDIKDLAVLVDGKSRYPVEIYDLPTSYTTKKDVPGAQALKEADAFVRCSRRNVTGTQLRRIYDDAGGTVGFEVRPLYFPLEFGQQDVLQVNYTLGDGRVRAYIRLDPDVQRSLDSSGSDDHHHGR
jgi:hypothetical protein